MKILAIMAGAMDGPVESGAIGRVIETRGYELCWCYRRDNDLIPTDIRSYEALIVFGGEVSVHDPELKTYFDSLATLIQRFNYDKKPVLGSCLGAQAIAYAFGGKVYPQGFLEYGFTPLTLTPLATRDPLMEGLDLQQVIFEMHSDTFDLPKEAELLMTGQTVLNQAYRIGSLIYGFQCHFEIDPNIVDTWSNRELVNNPNHNQMEVKGMIQTAQSDFLRFESKQTLLAETVVSRWLELVSHQTEGRING
ncbi:type 1 glutamine amidotransferase [Vibrio sp.]|nr:type 1 glutamine amidotransferase [Vibrio sp.]